MVMSGSMGGLGGAAGLDPVVTPTDGESRVSLGSSPGPTVRRTPGASKSNAAPHVSHAVVTEGPLLAPQAIHSMYGGRLHYRMVPLRTQAGLLAPFGKSALRRS